MSFWKPLNTICMYVISWQILMKFSTVVSFGPPDPIGYQNFEIKKNKDGR